MPIPLKMYSNKSGDASLRGFTNQYQVSIKATAKVAALEKFPGKAAIIFSIAESLEEDVTPEILFSFANYGTGQVVHGPCRYMGWYWDESDGDIVHVYQQSHLDIPLNDNPVENSS